MRQPIEDCLNILFRQKSIHMVKTPQTLIELQEFHPKSNYSFMATYSMAKVNQLIQNQSTTKFKTQSETSQ
jgi:hypothetical protein